jgi:hypothetical protein
MNPRPVAYLGAAACALVAVAVLAPYLVVPAAEQQGIGVYYGLGLVNPVGVALAATVAAVAFAAGAEGRSDPVLVAGLLVVVGVFSLAAAGEWALAFREAPLSDVVRKETFDLFSWHRWAVTGLTALWAASAAGFAWALGLLGR